MPALYLVVKRPVEMAEKAAASSLFSPSTEEEREAITVSNTVQMLDFEDKRYAAAVTISEQIKKIPVPKVAAKARAKVRSAAPKKRASSSTAPAVKKMPRKTVVLKPRKTAQMPWLLRYCAEKRLSSLKKATLKRCKAKTRARHYAKPDEHLTFSALEREMDRQLGSQGGSETKPLGPPRKSPASLRVGAGSWPTTHCSLGPRSSRAAVP